MNNQKEIIERIEQDEKYLVYVAGLLVEYNSTQNYPSVNVGDEKSTTLKPIWKGHVEFIKSICNWWKHKNYLSKKQHDSLLKTVKRYIDRVVIIFEILSNEIDNTTGSEIPIFSLSEFDAKCPNCGSRDFKIPKNTLDITYTCGSCGFVATYLEDEPKEYQVQNLIKSRHVSHNSNSATSVQKVSDDYSNSKDDNTSFLIINDKIVELVKEIMGGIYGNSNPDIINMWKTLFSYKID